MKSKQTKHQRYDKTAAGKARRQRYRQSPKGKAQRRASNAARRARRFSADTGTVDCAAVFEILQRDTCEYCRRFTPYDYRQLEHMQPLVLGGLHCVTNLCMACKKCNQKKGTRTAQAFREWLQTEEGFTWTSNLRSQH